jgi:hypothetical protein
MMPMLVSSRFSQVKGRRLDTDSGPRTRSRAAKQAERWDAVSLRLKLFVLTVDALLEAQAQVITHPGVSNLSGHS